jgi:hypothetical protein
VLFAAGSKRFVLAGGKRTKSYLVDRDCTNCSGAPNWCSPAAGQSCPTDNPNLVIQTLTQLDGISNGIVAGPAYYTGPLGTRIYYGFNTSPMAAFNFASSPPHLIHPPEVTMVDSAPSTSPVPAISSNGSSAGTGILWAVFHPAAVSDPLTLHAYDANDIHDNLFNRPGSTQMSLYIGGWVPTGNHAGNSFQVPTIIHGKVYTGSKNHLVVFGPQRPYVCSRMVDCGGAVTFYCSRDLDRRVLELQRKQNDAWKTVTNAATSRDLGEFVYLWDYPPGESATYRVCSKDNPGDCSPEFTSRANRLPCGLEIDVCGRPGSPPCFLGRPWPVAPDKRVRTNRPGRGQ